MYQKKRKKKGISVFLILGLVILCLSISYFVVQKKDNLNPIEALIKDSGLFIQKVILFPFRFLEEKMTDQELKKLKEQASASEALVAKNQELEYQLKELQKTLELNTLLTDRVYLNATVLNRNLDYWYQIITLDKGKHQGVEKNMPVIVSEGLIGLISEVSNYNSTVKLLTNEELPYKISVKIEIGDQYVYGLLTGYHFKNQTFSVEGIASNAEIPLGAKVVTTGLGEEMPAGIIVGYVKNITTDHFDLAKIVEIESKVNFDQLNYVTILKRKSNES